MNLFIESIHRGAGGPMGNADDEQRIREAMAGGREIRIAAGRRAEYRMPPGSRPVVHVLEGAVRFEGDDTAAGAGDSVWFKPVPEGGEEGVIGIEADAPFVGFLAQRPPGAGEARTGSRS